MASTPVPQPHTVAADVDDVVALIDIGFRSSSICILQQGELVLSRVVNIGGDRLTAAIGEAMNISYAEAEGITVDQIIAELVKTTKKSEARVL